MEMVMKGLMNHGDALMQSAWTLVMHEIKIGTSKEISVKGKWKLTPSEMTSRSMNWGIGWIATDWNSMIVLLDKGQWK